MLVVEDEPIVRGVITEMLGDQGYRTADATDGPSALQILRDNSQRIDLLVTDVGLPGMNGRQLADLAREARPDLKVLFMTGYAAGAAAKDFLQPGMRMITKPFDLDNLSRMIDDMIHNGAGRGV